MTTSSTPDCLETARLLTDGDVSSVEVTAAVLDRVAATEPQLHAFVTVDVDGAMEAAARSDARRRAGRTCSALDGVPIAIKDLADTAGLRTTYGSRVHAHHVPDRDSTSVTRLRRAGLVIVGKTTTPEFGKSAETAGPLHPPTANPWDLSRTCGGSSGGSAAAVAAGVVPAALGSDAGGSIRLPAAWCGVVGLRPTTGRVPRGDGIGLPAWDMAATDGPLTRTVADATALLALLAGPVPGDPASRHAEALGPVRPPADLRSTRVVWAADAGLGTAEPAVASCLHEAVEAMTAGGAHLARSTLRFVGRHPFLTLFDVLAVSAAAALAPLLPDHRDDLMPATTTFVDHGRQLSATELAAALLEARAVRAQVDRALQGHDVLVVPATATTAWLHGRPPTHVAGRPLASAGGVTYGALPYLAPFSLSGHPVLTLPCGLADGLPVGLQVVGHRGRDEDLLAVGLRLHEALGGSPTPASHAVGASADDAGIATSRSGDAAPIRRRRGSDDRTAPSS